MYLDEDVMRIAADVSSSPAYQYAAKLMQSPIYQQMAKMNAIYANFQPPDDMIQFAKIAQSFDNINKIANSPSMRAIYEIARRAEQLNYFSKHYAELSAGMATVFANLPVDKQEAIVASVDAFDISSDTSPDDLIIKVEESVNTLPSEQKEAWSELSKNTRPNILQFIKQNAPGVIFGYSVELLQENTALNTEQILFLVAVIYLLVLAFEACQDKEK